MKKQYLISLLGLAAIITPLGNCFFNDNQAQMWPMPNPDTVGEIVIEESSEVTVFDTNSDETVSTGDQLESIKIDASYYSNYNKYQLPPKDEAAYYIYYGDVDKTTSIRKHLEISYDELINIGGTYDKDYHTFSLDINSNDDYFTNYPQFWNYKIEDKDIEAKNDPIVKTNEKYPNGFEIRLNTTERFDDPNSRKHEISLGTVEINEEVTDHTIETTKVEIVDENGMVIMPILGSNGVEGVNATQTTATLNYKITPKADVYGNSNTEIISVEWWDLGNDGTADIENNSVFKETTSEENKDTKINAKHNESNDKLSGTFTRTDLEAGKDYNASEIRVKTTTTEDGKPIEELAVASVNKYSAEVIGPPTNVIEHIYVDNENNVLEVKGVIDSNGSEISSIDLVDKTLIDEGTNEDGVVWTDNEIDSSLETGITYTAYTTSYSGKLRNYKMVINYKVNGELSSNIDSKSLISPSVVDPTEEDLSKYINDGKGKPVIPEDDSSDGLGGLAIIGIIIGSMLGVYIIYWLIKNLSEKQKAKKD